jgi:acyl-CoA hydrolase
MRALPTLTTAAAVVRQLRPGMTVFVPGVSAESLSFYEALQAEPSHAAGVTFVGIHFPGINHSDYLGLHPAARLRAYFMSPSVRSGLAAGRAELVPLDYPGIVRELEEQLAIDVAIAQVCPPDANGNCSLGASQDFLPSVWAKASLRLAHVNPRLPRTAGAFAVRAGDCHLAFESDAGVPTLVDGAADETVRAHAALVASLVPEGATLQFGIGRLQSAILDALRDHRGLRIYSGMVSSSVSRLIDCGAIAGVGAIQTGVALGDAPFYERVGRDETFYFRPARETHDVQRIAALPKFCAINSAVSVDLFGQVNSEVIGGRLVAGAGGLPAFAMGARLAPGGTSITALAATADGGTKSRIIARPPSGMITTLPRYLADFVVTEFGIADLRTRGVDGRAQALIDVAAPEFRDELATEWTEILRGL